MMPGEEFPHELFEVKSFFSVSKKRKVPSGNLFDDRVILSRVTLVRNLKEEECFPIHADNKNLCRILQRMLPAVKKTLHTRGKDHYVVYLNELTAGEREYLSERFFQKEWQSLAPRHGSALCVSKDQCCSVFLNGFDHVNMMVTGQGSCAGKLLERIRKLDQKLGSLLEWNYDGQLGFLTSSWRCLGTGMRVYYLLFLPALSLNGGIEALRKALTVLGVDLKEYCQGENRGKGFFFELSNHGTLGESEEEILARMEQIVQRIAIHEKKSAEIMFASNRDKLLHEISSAYGQLRHAYLLELPAAVRALALLLLGTEMNMFRSFSGAEIADLLFRIQEGALQINSENKVLSPEELLAARAKLLRGFFEKK